MIILSETWLSYISTSSESNRYQIPNYTSRYINIGNGKGIATFNESSFDFVQSSSCSSYQVTKFATSIVHYTGMIVPIDIISLYRSTLNSKDNDLLSILKNMVRNDRICVICGDFNINFRNEPRHFLVSEILKMNFVQLIDKPTHRDGGIIDHLYLYQPTIFTEVIISWELFCPLYSDHFGISIILNKQNNPFIKTPSTIPDFLLEDSVNHKTLENNRKEKGPSKQKRRASSPKSAPKSRLKR